MQKKYKIYQLIETSLESKTETRNYETLIFTSYLLRTLDYEDWGKSEDVREGFDSLKEAEQFIETNIEKYNKWTIITEYAK